MGTDLSSCAVFTQGSSLDEDPVKGSVEIRSLTHDRFGDVFDLYDRAWLGDLERRKRAFQWLAEGNPFGDPARSYLLAYKDGTLAGYWGRMAMRFHFHGAPLTAVFNQEALVDPDFRKQGIARALMEEAVSSTELFLSLWHNEKIVSLLASHGWRSAGAYHPSRKVYRVDRLLRHKVKVPVLGGVLAGAGQAALALRRPPRFENNGLVVEEVLRFDADLDTFFLDAAPRFPFLADRTSPTLNWRFADIPHREFSRHLVREGPGGPVRGYLITETLDYRDERIRKGHMSAEKDDIRKGRIVDFLVRPDDAPALDALLGAADAEFIASGVDLADALHTLPVFQPALRRWGFRPIRKPGVGSQLLYLDRRAEKVPPPGDSYASWALTYGDSDGSLW